MALSQDSVKGYQKPGPGGNNLARPNLILKSTKGLVEFRSIILTKTVQYLDEAVYNIYAVI
jgi:hypothetical protein